MPAASTIHPQARRFADWNIWRCPHCKGMLEPAATEPALACAACGLSMPIEDDVLVLKRDVEANNHVAQSFYDSPLWPRFRFWERFNWICNGGERRARNKVLRYLPQSPRLDLLDVAIGDGVYLDWLPRDWRIAGVDISRTQLDACRPRASNRSVWLSQCEAERLPFEDAQFDAVLSIGAFNYFNDPEGSLREMVRVARPGAPVIVSDEIPNLTDRLFARKLGRPDLERYIVSRIMNLGDEFTDMVERYRDLDVLALARRVMPDCEMKSIWMGVGYVLVGQAPAR